MSELTATEIKSRMEEFEQKHAKELQLRLDKVHTKFLNPILDKMLEILYPKTWTDRVLEWNPCNHWTHYE